ncbi:MAG: hypothetical protein CMJ48_14940 [Planctomycetaceae bacterium]|nr:hypothetical protein [Planctomycetaceae bacterium]
MAESSESSTESSDSGRSRNWKLGAVAVVALIGLVAWLATLPRSNNEPTEDERALVERIVQLKNRGIALLENDKFTEADAPLAELAAALPDDPIGPRNLTVCRLLALTEPSTPLEGEARATTVKRAREALESLKATSADSPETAILSARILTAVGDETQAADELLRATKELSENAVLWYELYSVLQYTDDEAKQKIARSALARTAKLKPENLFIAKDWLLVQAQAKDPAIVDTFQTITPLVRPFVEAIQQYTGKDLTAMLAEGEKAAREGDWPLATTTARIVGNILKPEEVVRSDARRIHPHPLAFVMLDFGSAFDARRAAVAEITSQPAAQLKFVSQPVDAALAELKSVTDLTLVDFNSNDRYDIVALTPEEIIVCTREATSEAWRVLLRTALEGEFDRLHAFDLDADATADSDGNTKPADVDLILTGPAGVAVYENQLNPETGQRSLQLRSDTTIAITEPVLDAALVDLDHDGDLDLAASTARSVSLWFYRADFVFVDRSHRSQLPPGDLAADTLVPVDWNEDAEVDLLLISGRNGSGGLLENLRHGRFRWRQFAESANAFADVTSIEIVDADGDATWDLVAAGANGTRLLRTKSSPGNETGFRTTVEIDSAAAARMQLADFNNDGHLDILTAGASDGPTALFAGLNAGRFEPLKAAIDDAPPITSAFDLADLDADGDIDVVGGTMTGLVVLENQGDHEHHWLDVTLQAEQMKGGERHASGRVNHFGVGSVLELKAGTLYQKRIVTDSTTHFGLGSAKQADVLRVLWTNGIPQNLMDPLSDQHVFEKQSLKTSCPYLYTWTGDRFEFFTDLLWASPIGLQHGEGKLAPFRAWEYLKIPGDRLVPRNGRLDLRVTEELWEAAYFDQIRLLAVDHPQDVDVFTNEKVGPAEIARHRIYTPKHKRLPVAATDKFGRDQLPFVSKRDDRYARLYKKKFRQGLIEDHFLELDLGSLDDPQEIVLYLTGWIYPTDTSINVALSQDPTLDGPRPPALHVPDGKGGWREALPFMGFPGGKTKTIVVPVSASLFPKGDYRLRIATTAEIYWDEVFFTVDEQPTPARETELALESADFHDRGFSRIIEHPGDGPERYDYQHVSTSPKWPPMRGFFTRFGDVTELLESTDDRLVVLGAGDELRLSFRAPASDPPEGWTRDYVIHNVGWDKDADLNTVLGRTVEPLPFTGMKSYPPGPDEAPADAAAYRKYLQTWQTRTHSQRRFWTAIRDAEVGGSR